MWEYLIKHDLSVSQLDSYGSKDWELITVVFENGNNTFYFKREGVLKDLWESRE